MPFYKRGRSNWSVPSNLVKALVEIKQDLTTKAFFAKWMSVPVGYRMRSVRRAGKYLWSIGTEVKFLLRHELDGLGYQLARRRWPYPQIQSRTCEGSVGKEL